MDEQKIGDQQTRKSNSIGDLLNQRASRAECRRGNIGSAEVVDDHTDHDVRQRNDTLAHHQRLGVVLGISHLGRNTEESWGAGISKDECRNGS